MAFLERAWGSLGGPGVAWGSLGWAGGPWESLGGPGRAWEGLGGPAAEVRLWRAPDSLLHLPLGSYWPSWR